MNLTVLGAGAWGTALAANAALRQPTVLWARDAAQAATIAATRSNPRYLPGAVLPAALQVTGDMAHAMSHARRGLVIVATPMAALAEMLGVVAAHAAVSGGAGHGVLWLCKGFQQGSGWLGHEVARAVCPQARVGVLSGPSFAAEVARGQPTALVVASPDAALCAEAVQALHGETLRIYTSDDPMGVEVGGAVKNVLAIATGIADGMRGPSSDIEGLGLNARAALITRGLAEMTRLGVALGARAETFMGLSGLGDLVLTATGDLSRNRSVGRLLAQGLALPVILQQLGHVAEGVSSAPMVLARARALGVDMPITQAVVAVLEGRVQPAEALEQLMGRGARSELA
jgi:glycerol-3-phosphate dehydrogenase (NAD(P)+)